MKKSLAIPSAMLAAAMIVSGPGNVQSASVWRVRVPKPTKGELLAMVPVNKPQRASKSHRKAAHAKARMRR